QGALVDRQGRTGVINAAAAAGAAGGVVVLEGAVADCKRPTADINAAAAIDGGVAAEGAVVNHPRRGAVGIGCAVDATAAAAGRVAGAVERVAADGAVVVDRQRRIVAVVVDAAAVAA